MATDFGVLQAEVVQLDQRLETKLREMQGAAPDERLDAMQGVLEEMIEQRMQMRDLMKVTHQKLMLHLMQHVEYDVRSEGLMPQDSCPLVRRMKHQVPRRTGGSAVGGELDR